MDRKCSICGKVKPPEAFYPTHATRACKDCHRDKMRQYHNENKDELNKRRSKKRKHNKPQSAMTTRKCQRCGKNKYLSAYPESKDKGGRGKVCAACCNRMGKQIKAGYSNPGRGKLWEPTGNQYSIPERTLLVKLKSWHRSGFGYPEALVNPDDTTRLIQEGVISHYDGHYVLCVDPVIIDYILNSSHGWLSPEVRQIFKDVF